MQAINNSCKSRPAWQSHFGSHRGRITLAPHRRPRIVAARAAFNDVFEQCMMAHQAVEELGPVPPAVSRAWGDAWTQRLAEACQQTVTLHLDPHTAGTANVASSHSGVAEGRGGGPVLAPGPGSASNRSSSSTCEVTLVGLFHRDATNLRFVREVVAAVEPDAVALEARHSFLPAYGRLAAAVPVEVLGRLMGAPLRDLQETLEYITLEDRLDWHTSLVEANAELAASAREAAATSDAASDAASLAAASGTSALDPPKLLGAFLARELALSEKVAAAVVAGERGLPLHGIELDDPLRYSALLVGPLTGQLDPAAGGAPGGQVGGGGPSLRQLEAQQRRLGLDCLGAEAAEAFESWLAAVPQSNMTPVLQAQLAALIPQCLPPPAHRAYVAATDALWSDAGRAGAALAAQHTQLTTVRERHFLQRLREVAAAGGVGGRPCRRLVVVVGRTHAEHLRSMLALPSTGEEEVEEASTATQQER